MEPIRNRVQESELIQFELNSIDRVKCEIFNLSTLLRDGIIVVEKEFRTKLDQEDPSRFSGKGLAIIADEDLIIPDWAWMLITAKFQSAVFIIKGTLEDAKCESLRQAIENLNVESFRD